MAKSRNPKTVDAERKAREELQNPDMEEFDRAMRVLLKSANLKHQKIRSKAE